MAKIKVGILGSGNIGTDLMYKILKNDGDMELALLSGIDPGSEGLLRARDHGIRTSHNGIDAILEDPEIKIVFDATSAKAHMVHAEKLRAAGKMAIDLTPAAVGPFVVPTVNLNEHMDAMNVNMISCGGRRLHLLSMRSIESSQFIMRKLLQQRQVYQLVQVQDIMWTNSPKQPQMHFTKLEALT